jgi:hypothetical protein
MNDTAPRSVPVADEQGVTYYGLPSVKPSLCGGLVSGYMFVAGVGDRRRSSPALPISSAIPLWRGSFATVDTLP